MMTDFAVIASPSSNLTRWTPKSRQQRLRFRRQLDTYAKLLGLQGRARSQLLPREAGGEA
jgi:hypothetical protein